VARGKEGVLNTNQIETVQLLGGRKAKKNNPALWWTSEKKTTGYIECPQTPGILLGGGLSGEKKIRGRNEVL